MNIIPAKMKKIHWLLPFSSYNQDFLSQTDIASIRLRASVVKEGCSNSAYHFSAGEIIMEDINILVIGKISSAEINLRENRWLKQIIRAKERNTRIILDYTDNHYNVFSPMTSFYKRALPMIDAAVTSSNYLLKQLESVFKGPINVIPDAVEIKTLSHNTKTSSAKDILWFGHSSNINYLIGFLKSFLAPESILNLHILTNEMGIEKINRENIQIKNLILNTNLWSLKKLIALSSISDICIIPSDINDPKKAGVSSNRLITALALGLPVAADKLDSYMEFETYFTDIRTDKFFNLLKNPSISRSRVQDAQINIVPKFSPENISNMWFNFFDSIE